MKTPTSIPWRTSIMLSFRRAAGLYWTIGFLLFSKISIRGIDKLTVIWLSLYTTISKKFIPHYATRMYSRIHLANTRCPTDRNSLSYTRRTPHASIAKTECVRCAVRVT